MASYNTSGVTSYDPRNLGGSEGYGPSKPSSNGLASKPKASKMDSDMYAGSKYSPTSGAGTSKAKQTYSSAAAATANDDNVSYGQSYSPNVISAAFTSAGATLPPPAVSKPMTFRDYTGGSLYDSDIFKPNILPDNSSDINNFLGRAAIDDALREALGTPEVPDIYLGQSEEEPEPNIDMSVLQGALQPEPITVEEIEVKAGDTLTGIAAANNLPVQDVIDANPQIKNPDLIRPGEKVKLTKRLDTKGETPAAETPETEFPEVLSIPEAASYMGRKRAELIMKGINKLFGAFPPKTSAEKEAKTELEHFLDAQPDTILPDFFKYIPDAVQVQEYLKGRAERNKVVGTDPRNLGGAEGYGSVGTPSEADTGEGLMSKSLTAKMTKKLDGKDGDLSASYEDTLVSGFVDLMGEREGTEDHTASEGQLTYAYGITQGTADSLGINPEDYTTRKDFAKAVYSEMYDGAKTAYPDVFEGMNDPDNRKNVLSMYINLGRLPTGVETALSGPNKDFAAAGRSLTNVIHYTSRKGPNKGKTFSSKGVSKRRAEEYNALMGASIVEVQVLGPRETPTFNWVDSSGNIVESFTSNKPLSPDNSLRTIRIN